MPSIDSMILDGVTACMLRKSGEEAEKKEKEICFWFPAWQAVCQNCDAKKREDLSL